MSKLIGLIDCNNFFVSCERLFRPDLENRPVAVLSSNDGCIVARSKEVKDMGIPMGVPYFKVKDIIKDKAITLFSSHFALYRDVSRRVVQTLTEELDELQQYSIDEVFFTVPEEEEPTEFGIKLKHLIETRVGVPVSVGIAHSRTQAKYATDIAKKTSGGVHTLTPEAWQSLVSQVELSAIWGVGAKSFSHYKTAGYVTVADLLQADERRIKSLFGVVGLKLRAELQGESIDAFNAHPVQPQASIMSTRSFRETTSELAVLEDAIAYHVRHVAADLRGQNQRARVLRVSIRPSRHSDFLLQGVTLEHVFDTPTNDTFVMLSCAQDLLIKAFKADVPYKKAGVMLAGLQADSVTQDSLFGEVTSQKNQTVLALMDTINQHSGRELIAIGDRYKGLKWQARKDMQSPAYTTKWTDVALVKA